MPEMYCLAIFCFQQLISHIRNYRHHSDLFLLTELKRPSKDIALCFMNLICYFRIQFLYTSSNIRASRLTAFAVSGSSDFTVNGYTRHSLCNEFGFAITKLHLCNRHPCYFAKADPSTCTLYK